MTALDISHEQASRLDMGAITNGTFNFNPPTDKTTKRVLIIGGCVVAVVFLLYQIKKGKR